MIANIDGRFINIDKVIQLIPQRPKKESLLKDQADYYDKKKPFYIFIGLEFKHGKGMAGCTGSNGYKTKEECQKRIEEIVEKYNK